MAAKIMVSHISLLGADETKIAVGPSAPPIMPILAFSLQPHNSSDHRLINIKKCFLIPVSVRNKIFDPGPVFDEHKSEDSLGNIQCFNSNKHF